MNRRLHEFFSPRNIAVVGASAKNMFFANMVGYARRERAERRFFPVNPGAKEVYGIPTVPYISQLPDGRIDFAVVLVKSSTVLATIDELAGRGIKNIVLISGGFAETGNEGTKLQEELRTLCFKKDILLLGPNCLGFMNAKSGVSVFGGPAVERELIPGTIGIVGQSGAVSEAIASSVLKKGLGFSLFVTTGNEALLTGADCMQYMIESGTTRVIIGYMEGFRDISRLRQIALDAARQKIPMIFIKIGGSEKGKQTAQSHTGALAGDASVMEGFFKQYGIIRVETIEELVDTAGVFSRCPLPEGDRVGIVTMSGGLSGLYADLCGRLSINLPDLSHDTIASLKALLPGYIQPANPLDVSLGFASGMERMVKIVHDDECIDILLTISFPPNSETDTFGPGIVIEKSIQPFFHSKSKPVIPIIFREMTDYARKYYRDRGAYFIEHAEVGFKAVSHLIRYAQFQKRFRFNQGII